MDLFELIEADRMRLWSRPDRIGHRLAEVGGSEGRNLQPTRMYVLDIELWHCGTRDLARQAVNELRSLLEDEPRRANDCATSLSVKPYASPGLL